MNLLTALSMTSPFTPLPLRAQRPSRPALPPSNPAKPGFVEAKKLIDRGEITEEQAKLHPDRNKITRAIGAEEMVTPDYFELDLADGDMLLLCSDGLSSYGDDMDILDICFEYPTEEICDKLVDYANGNGGHDNISVALIAV